jgi:hypothetical protein
MRSISAGKDRGVALLRGLEGSGLAMPDRGGCGAAGKFCQAIAGVAALDEARIFKGRAPLGFRRGRLARSAPVRFLQAFHGQVGFVAPPILCRHTHANRPAWNLNPSGRFILKTPMSLNRTAQRTQKEPLGKRRMVSGRGRLAARQKSTIRIFPVGRRGAWE